MRDKKLEKLKEAYAGMSREQPIATELADREALEIIKKRMPIEDVGEYIVKLHRYASPNVKKQIEKFLADDPVDGTGSWLDRGFDKLNKGFDKFDRFMDRWL